MKLLLNAQMTRPPDNDKANATQLNSQAADPTTGPGASRTPGGGLTGRGSAEMQRSALPVQRATAPYSIVTMQRGPLASRKLSQ
jgi:hypothetical protein